MTQCLITNSLATIIGSAASAYGIRKAQITGPRKSFRAVRARQICMYIAYQSGEFTLKEIGHWLRRDHSTVLHGIHAIETRLESDQLLRNGVAQIEKEVFKNRNLIMKNHYQKCTDQELRGAERALRKIIDSPHIRGKAAVFVEGNLSDVLQVLDTRKGAVVKDATPALAGME